MPEYFFYYSTRKKKCKTYEKKCPVPGIVSGIRRRFLDKKTGLFFNREDEPHKSQFVNSLCILADVCTDEEARAVAEALVNKDAGLTPISLSTICFKYDALQKSTNSTIIGGGEMIRSGTMEQSIITPMYTCWNGKQ